jgi:DNA-binding MarR family transcriptional regulator/GNAT superfamily N-acetyltransferase
MQADVGSVRAFNRLYTRHIGLLDDHLDDSPFSLPQARVLYELAHRDQPTAAEIARLHGMDRAQLSRILKELEGQGLIESSPCPEHAKRRRLKLTDAGLRSFAALDQATQAAVSGMLGALTDRDRRRFVDAVETISGIIAPAQAPVVNLRDPEPGDLGWIIHRQAALYAEEYGWDWTYEALVAKILADFVATFDPAREQAWVAIAGGSIVGSIFLMRGDAPDVAKLRLLYVEKSARGLGVGRKLVDACVARARQAGYAELRLWTNSVLVSARRIYEAAGFVLIDETPHCSFGQDLVGQTWQLRLRP